MGTTYKNSGVDIDAGNEAVKKMKAHVKKTFRPEVLTELGSFAGLFALNKDKYEEPVLISGTDGVGTKLRIAMLQDKHDTVGIDAVAMCVNDILVQGAEPLFFLDYIAVGKLDPDKVADIVKGVAEGCSQSKAALIGGETAEMPGFYGEDEYDIAGFAVGVADKKKIITGAKVEAGHVILGLPSNGIHSNGFSLARKVLLEKAELDLDGEVEVLGKTLGEELLRPTRIYVKDVLPLLEEVDVKGMVHITGGGLLENIPRILPDDVQAEIQLGTWQIPEIFTLIAKEGEVESEEMFRVFNMGIGYCLVVAEADVEKVLALCPDALRIGQMVEGPAKVVLKEAQDV